MKSNSINVINAGEAKNYFVNKPISQIHSFYLSGHIEDPEQYIDWFETIRTAGEHDVIYIHVNSYGGDLFTAIQFMRVFAETSAHVVVSVEGACMSAATMLFMCADQCEVSEHSMFMFHNYSGGTIGKGGEMIDQLQHERKWSDRLLKSIYKGFLTDEEIKSMLDNKDLWMDGEEVVKRMKHRQQKLEEVAKKPHARKTVKPTRKKVDKAEG